MFAEPHIAEIEEKIEDKITWIQKKKDGLEEKSATIADVPQDLKDPMSKSASQPTENRGRGDALDIDE
ncbi:hypothetical protein QBC33DRAFT_534078 [Phialemonium atrogriseum]|uniref:Uncharacterized protein n=1 Tax=Phialemonium atrogriseum TaxID=1093897 RepID=A0AAJ0FHS3_9PEZI|nr:uncharacterized protein QBC33DRAFT_534078 [Phialemonium atrogriseum]KAK1768896.1 hypothetical protein QBC33DRAFT_534078 [Phialemonium atrogriseum]